MSNTISTKAQPGQTGSTPRRSVAPRERGPVASFLLNLLERTWLIIALVLLWFVVSMFVYGYYTPSLEQILVRMGQDWASGVLPSAIIYSLTNLVVGLAIAVVAGVVAGILLGEWRFLGEVLDPVIHFVRSIPQSALVPLIIGFFGLSQLPKIATIAFACVWPILLNTMDGVRGGEPTIRRFSKVYRIPPMLYFRRVVLPGAMPQIVAGVRVALPIGITVMVVSEFFGAVNGIGHYITTAQATFQIPAVWAGALIAGILGYVLSLLFTFAERGLLGWYFKSAAAN